MEQEIDKKMKNEFFMVAVDHIFKEGMVASQKELAEKIGITESTLSRIKNNKKFVGDETLRKMNEAFGGIFNMAYFRGQSVYLLKEDAADAMMKSVGKESPPQSTPSLPDPSSIMNAALSAQMQTIETQKQTIASMMREAASKEDLIANLRARIIEKDDHIATLKARIAELQQLVSIQKNTDLGTYPFPVGVADDKKQRKNL